ncbi:RNA polymerase sigma factor [Telluribacter sp.]|jgi:RNA polymerase sigma-70 factor (ECF subfamily)|uniref:RNA polymerase sigma factor n=1 Tax=Telluribacter sp. TaxID=1978767 RepID=UPI002E131585|nr:RNA polymerase sigma factor [Telluribacter sp.]
MATKTYSYSESDLIASLKRNERQAFEYLYDNYSGTLYCIICKIIKDEQKAEDAMQESFLKIWKNIQFYSSDKGTLFTWMLNIARNTAIDILRKDRRVDNSKGTLFNGLDFGLNPFISYQPLASTFDLKDLVDRLRPERKVLVDLVYFQGYTHEEASEKLSMPLGTVKSRIRTALQDLRVLYI